MNNAVIAGRIAEASTYDHEAYKQQFYRTKVCVENKIGKDYVPVLLNKKFFEECGRRPKRGDFVKITGPIRTINELGDDGKTHLRVRIIANGLTFCESEEEQVFQNEVKLKGKVCSDKGEWRVRPGREKRDFVVATYRDYGRKRDYINCPVWKRRKLDISKIRKGTSVRVEGRFHSRNYFKYEAPDSPKGELKEVYEVTVEEIVALGR